MGMQTAGAQSLGRAFGILEILAAHEGEMALAEVAERSGLNKSTVHRILSALTELGYVRSADGRYSLTLKMFEVGSMPLSRLDITAIARSHLERLRDAAQETVHLVTLDQCDIVYIQKLECSSNAYQMASHIGMRRAAYCTAAGKSILSTMTDRQAQDVFEASDVKPITARTITDFEQLRPELAQARQTQVTFDEEENEPGMRCVASPIRDYTGRARYAISLSAPLVRMDDERMAELVPLLRQTSADISAELGFKGSA